MVSQVSLKLSKQSHYKEAGKYRQCRKNINQAEMAESEGILAIVNQVTI